MKSYLAMAWKELKAQKVTAFLILIAVVLSTVMTTVVGQSVGILQSMRFRQAESLNGNRYATFHQLNREQADRLREDSRLYDVGNIIFVGSMPLGSSSLNLFLREYDDQALDMYPSINKIQKGRLPEQANEIALSEETLRYLGFEGGVGDKISLDLTVSVMDGSLQEYGYRGDFILTGILESSYMGYASGIVEGIVGAGTAEKLLPEEYLLYSTDFKTESKRDFQRIVDDLAASLSIEERYIQYNWVLLDALGIPYSEAESGDMGAGFSFMAAACVLTGVLVLFAAGLVIYNILKISVAKKVKEYGTLRAIGGERGQIYRLVSLQLLILCGIGIPAGLLLGVLSAKGVLAAAAGLLNPELFLVNSTADLHDSIRSAGMMNLPMLPVSVAITLLFALLAAFPAARYASSVSPTVAMSGQTGKIRRRVRRKKRIRNFEAYYARLNLKRGRGRTAITVLSLVMSISVFVALQSFTGLLDASQSVQGMYKSDYAVTNETIGIPAGAVRELEANDAVEKLSTARLSIFMPEAETAADEGAETVAADENETSLEAPFEIPFEVPFETDLAVSSHETIQLASVDDTALMSYVDGLSEQDRQALLDGTGCLIKNPIAISYGGMDIEHTNLSVGETIRLGERTVRIVGLADNPVTINNDGFINGVQVIVNDEIYCSLMGDDSYAEIYPTLKEDADVQGFEDWLDGWCEKEAGTHWLSYRQSGEEMAESFQQIKMLCWILIVFIGAIGILNIINTVYSNIHTRVQEIGMQRAIGMSRGSLYRTFLWEGAYYGMAAAVIGGIVGYICTIFIDAASTDTIRLSAVPVGSIAEAAVFSVGACLLATCIPLRRIARMGIVEAVEAVE